MTPPRAASQTDARARALEDRIKALEDELDQKSVRIMRDLGGFGDRIDKLESEMRAELRRMRDRFDSLEREERKLRNQVESLPDGDGLATNTGVHRLEKLQEVLKNAAATEAKLAIAQRDVESYRAKALAYEQKQTRAEERTEKREETKGDRRFELLKLLVMAILGIVGGALGAHYTSPPLEAPPAIHAPATPVAH